MTLHIELDPGLEESLNVAAQSEGLSVEDFVRGCLKKQLANAPAALVEAEETSSQYSRAFELGKHLFGSFDSGRTDTSTRDEEILGEIFDEKRRRRGH